MATLYLFCGLPGSGKTTVAGILADETGAIRLSPDAWLHRLGVDAYHAAARTRVEDLQWLHAQELLERGVAVILEFGFWSRAERDEKRVRARELAVSVELWFLDADVDTLWARLDRRNGVLLPGAVHVERADLLEWAELFEAPDAEELARYDTPEDLADGPAAP